MDLTTYRASLPVLFKSRVTPLIWGAHGVGKSSVPEQYARDNNSMCINLRLGNLESGDLLGLQDFETEGYTDKKIATKHFKADWLNQLTKFCEENPDKWGILHLDEINHIRRDLTSFVWQMCLDKRLHTFKFPDNLAVIASANPPTKDYPGTLDFKNKALLSRFCHLSLRPTPAETITYLRSVSGDSLANFLSERTNLLHGPLEPFSTDEFCKPCPRSWELVARLQENGGVNELIYGLVGAPAAEAYLEYLRTKQDETFSPDDVMLRYPEIRTKVKKKIEEGKHAELKLLAEAIQTTIVQRSEAEKEFVYPKDVSDNVADFSMDLPIDHGYAFLLVVAGPTCPAIMDGLDAREDLVSYIKDAMATGKIKVETK